MPLTDIQIKNAKPKERVYRLRDGIGLFLEVRPNGARYWRFRGTYEGQRFLMGFGVYPQVSLAQARERAAEAKTQLAKGIDPRAERAREREEAANPPLPFEALVHEWIAVRSNDWSAGYTGKVSSILRRDILPHIGGIPVRDLAPPAILAALRLIEDRGNYDTARTALQLCGQILRYGVATGQAERDVAADLRGALTPYKVKHHASLTNPKDIAQLLIAMDSYQGTIVVRCALRLTPLLFVRPGELRRMEWAEINVEAAEWRIPAEKMKMRMQHIVPLSRQALAILEEIRPHTGDGKYVFPCVRTPARPMSENAIGAALKYLGYSTREQQTAHGFRSMASTILKEQGWNRDWIERQLAHTERDGVRAAYNYADYLPERVRMMQHWSDYLDQLKEEARGTP